MGFLAEFSKNFSVEERNTELYNLWSSIGVNMEKAILEEQQKLNDQMIDINVFSEDTLRSWLAFFLKKIPYRTSSTVEIDVTMTSDTGITTIPQYEQLMSNTGVIYTQLEELKIKKGDKLKVMCVQGKRITEMGTYNGLIKVQANNPDLSYITVKINDVEIPEVEYALSSDGMSYIGSWSLSTSVKANPVKGQFYNVIQKGRFNSLDLNIGDILVFDGNQWTIMNNQIQNYKLDNSYGIPRDGYFAYYYDNYLYIKVFAGDNIANPIGMSYEISYISSDGVQGEINKDDELTYVSDFVDSQENTVELSVTHEDSTAASNEPSVGKLSLFLKERLFSTINVSSIPEYTAWFRAQPEIGDCVVLSDYEKFIRNSESTYNITGIIDVFAVGNDGNNLSSDIKSNILARLENYKDVGKVQFTDFVNVNNYFIFSYTDTNNITGFEQFIASKVKQYYDVSYLQSISSSIFEDLDLAELIKDIQNNSPFTSIGLTVKAYHYKKITDISTSNPLVQTSVYDGDVGGYGFYRFHASDDSYITFKEIKNQNGDVIIYTTDGVSVGNRSSNVISINLTGYGVTSNSYLECFWGSDDNGILKLGTTNAKRSINDDDYIAFNIEV